MRIHEFLIGFQICILIVPMSYDNFSTFVTQQNADYNRRGKSFNYAVCFF